MIAAFSIIPDKNILLDVVEYIIIQKRKIKKKNDEQESRISFLYSKINDYKNFLIDEDTLKCTLHFDGSTHFTNKNIFRPNIRQHIYSSGTIYTGQFSGVIRQGAGEIKKDKEKFTGYFFNGSKNGLGVCINTRNVYKGNYVNDIKNGYGENRVYKGHFLHGLYCGFGIYKSFYRTYYGFWEKGYKKGLGVLEKNGKIVYCGNWCLNHYSGFGYMFDGSGYIYAEWEHSIPGKIYEKKLNGIKNNLKNALIMDEFSDIIIKNDK